MAISANDPRPKHRQIADWIIELVIDGSLAPGDRLPSARELMEQFEVSNQTAHSAIKSLQADGLAVGVQGRGTFLSSDLDVEALALTHEGTDEPSADYVVLRDQLDALAGAMQVVNDRLDEIEHALGDRLKQPTKRS